MMPHMIPPMSVFLLFTGNHVSKAESMQHCGDQDSKYFTRKHPKPLPNLGRLKMTLPDKPQSHNQSILRFKRTHQKIREPGEAESLYTPAP